MVQKTTAFAVDGFVEMKKELESLMTTNPDMEKKVQKIIGDVLKQVRNNMVKEARLVLDNDPRQAYRAVRHSVYRRILGGQVNILSKKRAGNRAPVASSRRGRSQRTTDLMSYYGADRGFILRFFNAGTKDRVVRTMNDDPIKRTSDNRPKRRGGYKGGLGNRGHITSRGWFGNKSGSEMNAAAENLSRLIDELINKEFNK